MKLVARNVLEALAALHEKGFVHSGRYFHRFTEIQPVDAPTMTRTQVSNQITSWSATAMATTQPILVKYKQEIVVMRIASK